MKSFQQFILEANAQDQLGRVGLAVSIDMPDNLYIHDKAYNTSKIFKLFTKEEKADVEDIPVFNYANWKIEKMISDGWNPELVYNKIEAKERVSSKVEWHKLHEGSSFIPKVAYDAKGLKDLEFPIVAKPDNRYAGQGIVVFKTQEDVDNANLSNFEVFSEKIDIKEEFRLFCWRGEPLMLLKRIPADEKTKTLDKTADDKLKFNYEKQPDGAHEPFNDVIAEFSKVHDDLDFYTMDVVLDKDDKPFIIEMSSEPGPIFSVLSHVYGYIYEDFYGEPLLPETKKIIDTYIKEDIEQLIKSEKGRFSVK